MEYLVNINGVFINVEDSLNKIKISNKKDKKQYDYILLIIVRDEDKIDFKFFYLSYYKTIKYTLKLIFDNSFKFWKSNNKDSIYIRNPKRLGKLYIISNNDDIPSVQWILTKRKNEEYYNNDKKSLNFFLKKSNRNKSKFTFLKCIDK